VPDENVFAIGAAMPGHYGPATTGVTLTETTFAGRRGAHRAPLYRF